MAQIKFTKNELKKQKDGLKRFMRYLPTLILKKQQLQMVIRQIESQVRELKKEQEMFQKNMEQWIELFAEDIDLSQFIEIENIEYEVGNIAGVDIPVFKGLSFKDISWDLINTSYWIDSGIEHMKKLVAFDAELTVLEKQKNLLEDELRITTQRVNLFEKVKIPETKENIRQIRIYLGDQQTAAVVRGKIAKNKVVKVSA